MIQVTESKLHWNYFIALERDLEQIARFVEFSKGNFHTFSIELAHLLFAASSEIDVVGKALCELLSASSPKENIDHYRTIITTHLPELLKEKVHIHRYGLTLDPWQNWRRKSPLSPHWWNSYNKVKHHRNQHYDKANLINALNAMSGLLVTTFYYYRQVQYVKGGIIPQNKQLTSALEPPSTLLTLDASYYYDNLVV